jgi:hypothetical protein
MVKVLDKLGLSHYRRNLYMAFEDVEYVKYKRLYTKELYELDPNTNNVNSNVHEVHNYQSYLPEESKLIFDEIKDAYAVIKNANYRMLSRRQMQEGAEMGLDNKTFVEEQCKIRSIPILADHVTHDNLASLDQMNPFREVTHLQKPERREGAAFKEWEKFIEDAIDFKEKLAQFPPPLDLDFQFAKAIHAFRMFIRPTLDDKWRRDYPGWAEILAKRKDTTKHGAQSMSELEGAKIRGYDETGKPIKVYKGITCEQIDNKAEVAAEAFIYMYKNIPILYYMGAVYRAAKVPFFVDFTADLSPKLSHSS